MSIRAVISVSMIVVIVLFAICLAVYVAVLSHRLEHSEKALEEAQALNVQMQAEMAALRDDMIRSQEAGRVFNDRIEQAAHEHADKIQTLEDDKNACDWMDAVLPASVRDSFVAACGSSRNNAAIVSDDGMQQAEGGSDGN